MVSKRSTVRTLFEFHDYVASLTPPLNQLEHRYILKPQQGSEFETYILRYAAMLLRNMPEKRVEAYFRDEIAKPNGRIRFS